MADSDFLPPYNALFPEEETNVVVNGRRRFTTITLREIYYPAGCPCHPKEKKLSKKAGKSAARLPMARARTTFLHRAVSEPQQRELVTFKQHEHQRGFECDRSTGFDSPVRRFEILKSTPLGVVFPQNVYFSVKDLDAGIAHSGYSSNLSSDKPVFITNELKWWKQKYVLPPSFELFRGGDQGVGSRKPTNEPRRSHSDEITGLPPASTHDGITVNHDSTHTRVGAGDPESYPLAKIKYRGWEGVTHFGVSLTLYNITPDMHYQNDFSNNLTQDFDSGPNIRSQYSIVRKGLKREYIFVPGNRKWRSPSSSEKNSLLSKSALDDTFPVVHGNLILEDSEANIVAVYKQRRDYEVLGNLTVFSNHVSGPRQDGRNEQEGKITVEAVVGSCLAIVVYERIGWQNLWGN
ncbi:hypothetical protein H2200_005860 [Cladophialophora chaetospira]|uniref:Uncharacterized protein n=1 Tax=Cladophialophora chaetospira TaxID=386627 RepID=A0AA38X9Y5_9EURO|nr:hypothetical protein H2200_005860 [Cladophialophora chaetospira]